MLDDLARFFWILAIISPIAGILFPFVWKGRSKESLVFRILLSFVISLIVAFGFYFLGIYVMGLAFSNNRF